jgi:hypothetical protein
MTTIKEKNMTTIKQATKVGKRGWSYKTFQASVNAAAERAGVNMKGKMARVQACYDEGVTVRDTLNVIRGSRVSQTDKEEKTT